MVGKGGNSSCIVVKLECPDVALLQPHNELLYAISAQNMANSTLLMFLISVRSLSQRFLKICIYLSDGEVPVNVL